MRQLLALFLIVSAFLPAAAASDGTNTQGIDARADRVARATQNSFDRPWRSAGSTPLDTDAGCFSIDAYRVRRDSPDSDVTFPAGHETCIPAARFKVKNAITPVVGPEPQK